MLSGCQYFLHVFICLIVVAGICLSLYVPWVLPNVLVDYPSYTDSVPLQIGLFRCLSTDACPWSFFSGADYSSGAATSNFDKISVNENEYDPASGRISSFESKFCAQISPFVTASLYTLPFLFLACLLCAVSAARLVASLLCSCVYGWNPTENPKFITQHVSMLVLAMFSLLIGVHVYVWLTYSYLNGGRYIDGVLLLAYLVVSGIVTSVLSIAIARLVVESEPDLEPEIELGRTSEMALRVLR